MLGPFRLIMFGGGEGSSGYNYIQIPNRPTFADPLTITVSDFDPAIGVVSGTIGSSKEIILDGLFSTGLRLNGISGQIGDPLIFSNNDVDVVLGDSDYDSRGSVDSVNSVDYIEFIGKSASEPLLCEAGAGRSAFAWAGKEVTRICNAIINGVGFAGIHANPSSGTYSKLVVRFVRNINSVGEIFYIGSTSNPFGVYEMVALLHNYSLDSQWDGLQIGHINDVRIYNLTFRNVGLLEEVPHDHLFQVNDSNGVIENCMFDIGPKLSNLFAHGVTFRNCHFRIPAVYSSMGYVGRTDNLAYYPTSRHNGLPVKFENCTFQAVGGTVDYVLSIAERIADYEFEDCGFDGVDVGIYDDIRTAGFSNSLIGTLSTNGNYTDTFPEPEYDSEGRLTTAYFLNRGIGAFTNPPSLLAVDVREFASITGVEYDTPFASLGLPTNAIVLKNDGLEVELPITWDSGDYSQTTEGEQIISGTIDFEGLANPHSIGNVEVSVTVLPEPDAINDYTTLINLTNVGSVYAASPDAGGRYWNTLRQSFGSGTQVVYGDDEGDTLASLRNAAGDLTGYQVVTTGNLSGALDGENVGSPAEYPIEAIRGFWNHPSTTGTRSFTITGLSANPYIVKILCSRNDGFGGTYDYNIVVSGSSGGGTINILTADVIGNISVTKEFAEVVPNSGVITIGITAGTGTEVLNIIELIEVIP